MRYLSVNEVIALHHSIIQLTGGAFGLRDIGALESAVAQPRMTFEGADLYTSLHDKAAAMGFSVIQNHPFIDGNKRVGHAAIETFLMLNGDQLTTTVDDAEQFILDVAAGNLTRERLSNWIEQHIVAI